MAAIKAGKILAASIVVDYAELSKGANLKNVIEKAYGPQGLGILFVNGIPNYPEQRKKTLKLFHKLANLPKQTLKKYERPEIYHSLGWSYGVQKFQDYYDTSKGSYYVNVASDQAYPIKKEDEHYYTEYEKQLYSANRWVQDIPQIQVQVKSLSRMMMDVGALLAVQIDDYAKSKVPTYPTKYLQKTVKTGKKHLGRMLHYFPFQQKGETEDDWCGWHNDFGCLTGLTSALYTDKSGQQITFPLKTGGLLAKNRFADTARILIPQDMLAFQLGQSTQILSGGCLEATPHCVSRSQELSGLGISRNTFTVFIEPEPLDVLKVPQGIDASTVRQKEDYKVPSLKERWDNGMFFKDFHQRTLKKYND